MRLHSPLSASQGNAMQKKMMDFGGKSGVVVLTFSEMHAFRQRCHNARFPPEIHHFFAWHCPGKWITVNIIAWMEGVCCFTIKKIVQNQ